MRLNEMYHVLIEEGNQRDGFMGSCGTVQIIFKMIWIIVNRCPQWRIFVFKVLLEGRWQKLAALLGEDAQKLLERLKRLPQLKIIKLLPALCKIIEIER